MSLLHFFLDNGIGQNITAGALTIILGLLWSRTKFWPLNILKRIHKNQLLLREGQHQLHVSHREIHTKLDALHEHQQVLHDALARGPGPETSNLGD